MLMANTALLVSPFLYAKMPLDPLTDLDLVAGQIAFMIENVLSTLPLVKDGKLRARQHRGQAAGNPRQSASVRSMKRASSRSSGQSEAGTEFARRRRKVLPIFDA